MNPSQRTFDEPIPADDEGAYERRDLPGPNAKRDLPEPIEFVRPAMRWEQRTQRRKPVLLPNVADTGSRQSIEISRALWHRLGVPTDPASGAHDAGGLLEHGIAEYLSAALPLLDERPWHVQARPGKEMTETGQYSHFAHVRDLIQHDQSLSASIGMDYIVKPDVTVHLPRRFDSYGAAGDHPRPEAPLLHASVSCKWTLRSDRAQNVRTEAAALLRFRCGRVPHIVVVTAEPTVGRIGSVAKGTGDIDAVFHVALPELIEATEEAGFPGEAAILRALARQGRLLDLRHLPDRLAEW